jgi:hypothetical protein
MTCGPANPGFCLTSAFSATSDARGCSCSAPVLRRSCRGPLDFSRLRPRFALWRVVSAILSRRHLFRNSALGARCSSPLAPCCPEHAGSWCAVRPHPVALGPQPQVRQRRVFRRGRWPNPLMSPRWSSGTGTTARPPFRSSRVAARAACAAPRAPRPRPWVGSEVLAGLGVGAGLAFTDGTRTRGPMNSSCVTGNATCVCAGRS